MTGTDLSFEAFLDEQGIKDEVYGAAIKRVIARQLEEARTSADISKTAMASGMGTSRAQVERVLDPENVAVSLETLDRAARAVGKRLVLDLKDL
ncbi:XRE family transcriptional regulator [Aerophototrophica crusticola]|uniref:XRE family transcriptional regulator n=1 Tax=Aerophototrophica crusticola TaxID=1709002 RepID=A0A858RA05_9PROT|nr:XRE family transcriptional regulator [Rhodospirillaceae bacterium B3]